jgi:tubulin polyglutamylase TTLL6/13
MERDTQVKPEEASVSKEAVESSDSEIGDEDDGSPVKRTGQKPLIMNIADTKYPVVKFVARKMLKWKVCKELEDRNFDLFWTDQGVTAEMLSKLACYQKINHFPGNMM